MAMAVRLHQIGPPEVLACESMTVGDPGPGQVRLRQVAIGINAVDLLFRSGRYPMMLPGIVGVEASGVVQAIGEGVVGVCIGDRVSYAGMQDTLGAYATQRLIDAKHLVVLPDTISFEMAAAMSWRGLMAATLIRTLHGVPTGANILVHGAAGGVGHLLAQWARWRGLRVIGTVSSREKVDFALAHGCHEVIELPTRSLVRHVELLTAGAGVAAVLDGLGRDSWHASFAMLARHGLMVSYGELTGPAPATTPFQLARAGSLTLVCPRLQDSLTDTDKRDTMLSELFRLVEHGDLRIALNQCYDLKQAALAHRDIEARRTMGCSIFVV